MVLTMRSSHHTIRAGSTMHTRVIRRQQIKKDFWSGGNRTSDEGVDGCRRDEQRFDPVGYTVGRLDVGLVQLGEVSDGAALDDDAHGIGFPQDDDVSALNGLDHRVVVEAAW